MFCTIKHGITINKTANKLQYHQTYDAILSFIYLGNAAVEPKIVDPFKFVKVFDGVVEGLVEKIVCVTFRLAPAEPVAEKADEVRTTTIDLKGRNIIKLRLLMNSLRKKKKGLKRILAI